MSRLLTCLILIFFQLFSVRSIAQDVPDSISYQAVVRDAAGNELANQSVTIEFAIRKNSTSGTLVFEENHNLIPTNQYGLFSAMIGNGTTTGAGLYNSLGEIQWQDDIYFLEVRAAIPGEGTTQIIGVSQLLTVPYAFYAATAGSVLNETDGDPDNELISDFALDGTMLTITENETNYAVDLAAFSGGEDADANPENELITAISLTPEHHIEITEGGTTTSVDISSLASDAWVETDTQVYCEDQNVGVGTSDPSSTFMVEGSMSMGVTMLNAGIFDISADGPNASTSVLICNVTDADVTVQLMPASSCPGRFYKFRKMFTGVITSNDVNIAAAAGEMINGFPIYQMTHVYAEYLTIISNGTAWYVIDHSKE